MCGDAWKSRHGVITQQWLSGCNLYCIFHCIALFNSHCPGHVGKCLRNNVRPFSKVFQVQTCAVRSQWDEREDVKFFKLEIKMLTFASSVVSQRVRNGVCAQGTSKIVVDFWYTTPL